MAPQPEVQVPWNEAVRMIAREAAQEVMHETIAEHVRTCPVLLTARLELWKVVGMILGSGLLGGGAGAALAKTLWGS